MLYQIGLILILVVIALIIGKLKKTNNSNEQLVFEDDMTEEELKIRR